MSGWGRRVLVGDSAGESAEGAEALAPGGRKPDARHAANPLVRFIAFLNRKNVMLFLGCACGIVLLALVLFGRFLEPNDPTAMDLTQTFVAPCAKYPFGTDNLGRCIFSRVIEGAAVSLPTAVLVVLVSVIAGTLIGLLSGFVGGRVDAIIMRIVDVFLAFPTIVFALAMAALLGTGQASLVVAISCIQWTRYVRMARGEVVLLRNAEYVEAGRAIGNPRWRIMLKYLLPNVASKNIILMSLDVGSIILYCASLSFLGLGAQPPTPDWGVMVSDGKDYLRHAPWMSVFPGVAIAFSALSFNMIGDGLRDKLDPRMRESAVTE